MGNVALRCLLATLALALGLSPAGSIALGEDGEAKSGNAKRADSEAGEIAAALAKAEAAERRAGEAEAAAARAIAEARAAREESTRALEAARQAQQALLEMRQLLAASNPADPAPDIGAVSNPPSVKSAETVAPQRTDGQVTTQSGAPLNVYGQILVNSTWAGGGSNNADVPLFALQSGTPAAQNHQSLNITARQTRFGFRYEARVLRDARLTGVLEFDLFGGKPAFPNGSSFDLLRLRLAYGRIDWQNDSFEVGQDWAVFAPLNPTSLASYAIPAFAASGNLWIRQPQVRYERRSSLGQQSRFVLTGALADPNAGDNAGNPAFRPVGLGERGSLPDFQGRMGVTTPSHGRDSSFGISARYARFLGVAGSPPGTTVRSPIDSYGLAADANIWASRRVRISGEVFHGRALGLYSGGIAQSAAVIDGRARGINSTGGWFELHLEPPDSYQGFWGQVSWNFGYGIENNRDQDLVAGLRKRNQTFMANAQYRVAQNVTFAAEYRNVRTDWFRDPLAKRQLSWVNLAMMYSF